MPDDWSIIEQSSSLLLCKIDMEPSPHIVASLVINDDLKLSVYFSDTVIIYLSKDQTIPDKISNLNQISLVIDAINSVSWPKKNGLNVHVLQTVLHNAKENMEEFTNVLDFISQQIKLLGYEKHCRRYSADIIIA